MQIPARVEDAEEVGLRPDHRTEGAGPFVVLADLVRPESMEVALCCTEDESDPQLLAAPRVVVGQPCDDAECRGEILHRLAAGPPPLRTLGCGGQVEQRALGVAAPLEMR